MVRVYEEFGYEVVVPDQRCSGTPMFANGMLDDARRAAKFNVETFAELIDRGYDVIASCTSCSMALRQEYPELFDFEEPKKVATNTYEALEYLRIHEDLEGALEGKSIDYPDLAYHAPCHARNQGLDRQAVELFREVDGVDVEDVGPSCSGISGTYGWKEEKYEKSMKIGSDMFEHMKTSSGQRRHDRVPDLRDADGTRHGLRHPPPARSAGRGVSQLNSRRTHSAVPLSRSVSPRCPADGARFGHTRPPTIRLVGRSRSIESTSRW